MPMGRLMTSSPGCGKVISACCVLSLPITGGFRVHCNRWTRELTVHRRTVVAGRNRDRSCSTGTSDVLSREIQVIVVTLLTYLLTRSGLVLSVAAFGECSNSALVAFSSPAEMALSCFMKTNDETRLICMSWFKHGDHASVDAVDDGMNRKSCLLPLPVTLGES